jgi:ParB family chromosome partitioning protein
MRGSAAKIQMASLDDLFGGVPDQVAGDQIQEISLSELHPFKNHPFHVVDDEKMQEMAESVAQYGVLVPGIVRPQPEGGYEIVAGHRRRRASELAGKATMPVIIRDMDDDEATIIMVDSNLQRERILPSEKAFAYRMKLEAMKRTAGRPAKDNSVPVAQNFRGKTSREILGEQVGESQDQIRRFIRLTELIPGLLALVDQDKLPLRPAVEISYIPLDEQELLYDVIEDKAFGPPSLEQAKGVLTQTEYFELKEDYSKKISAAAEHVRQLQAQQYELERQMEDFTGIADNLAAVGEDTELTAQLVDKLIRRITVNSPEDVSVDFTFDSGFERVREVLENG